MAGRVQFLDRKAAPVGWPARLFLWVQERFRALRGTAGKPTVAEVERPRRVRIRVFKPDLGLVIHKAAVRCPACGIELQPGSETVACSMNSSHVVHARCSAELLKGKCPHDGALLKAAS